MKDELSSLPNGRQIIFQYLVVQNVNVKTTASTIGPPGREERGAINEGVQLHFTIAQFRYEPPQCLVNRPQGIGENLALFSSMA